QAEDVIRDRNVTGVQTCALPIYSHIRKKVTDDEVISLIDQENDQYPVHTLCEVLEVPRSTYYQSLTKTVSNRDKENQQLTNRILEIYHERKRRYGAPKIHYLLNQEGYNVSLKRVQRLMKKVDIQSITVKKFRPTTSKEKDVEHDHRL